MIYPNVVIVIVNWNGKHLLEGCLNSLRKQTYKNFACIVVDNGSTDGSCDLITNNFPFVLLLPLSTNHGFARGSNEGIKYALKKNSAEYIICLNNDTIVDKNWIEGLVDTVKSDNSIGMVSSKAVFPSGNIQNAGLSLEKGFYSGKLGNLSIGYNYPPNSSWLSNDREIFAPSGVACLYKREMLEEIGLFDEQFFAYAEDFDLGFRARLAGWKCYFSSKAKIVHLHSQTSGANSLFKITLNTRNLFFTAIKNMPVSLLPEFLYSFVTKRIGTVRNKKSDKNAKKKGYRLLIFPISRRCTILKYLIPTVVLIPLMIFKRLLIQKSRTADVNEIKSWFKKFSREAIEK